MSEHENKQLYPLHGPFIAGDCQHYRSQTTKPRYDTYKNDSSGLKYHNLSHSLQLKLQLKIVLNTIKNLHFLSFRVVNYCNFQLKIKENDVILNKSNYNKANEMFIF